MEFLVARGGSNYSDVLTHTHTHTHISIFISKMALNAANEKQLIANDSQNTLGATPPPQIKTQVLLMAVVHVLICR